MPGKGRPRKFDIDIAIAQAMDLFHQRGYDGAGIAELSRAIGITAPSLYSAFGSKRELFEQVLQHYVKTQGCWLTEALQSGKSLEAAIGHLFSQAAEAYAADPERPGCLIIDGTRNCSDADAKVLTAGLSQATWQLVRDRIAAEVPKLSASEADSLADYAVTVLVGLSGRARDGAGVETLRTSAEIATDGFCQRLSLYRDRVSS